MPMDAPGKFGTNADGSRSEEYCVHCYQKGAFTRPEMTLDQMIEFCARMLAEKHGLKAEEARAMLAQFLPKLKRWRETR
jgi:hypothetical protein